MNERITNPAGLVPGAMEAILALNAATHGGPVPPATLRLLHLRASQVNGCAPCLEAGTRHAKAAGETDTRLATVAAWREAPYFDDAERAALALAEAVTRLSDRPDPVPDEVWGEAARHFDEAGLVTLVLSVATTNLFNRLNVATRQLPGKW